MSKKRTDTERFESFLDALADSVLETSDDEILEELRQSGVDPHIEAARLKAMLLDTIESFRRCGLREGTMNTDQTRDRSKNLPSVIDDVCRELYGALDKFPPFTSPHEGYAIIKEELDELWEEIRKQYNTRTKEKMRKEAIQVAAMAIRFVYDLLDEDRSEP